jgi:hypothetical protein
MPKRLLGFLAPVGSTGNNTHASLAVQEDAEVIGLEFKIEAVGATPTVTYKYQGSEDGPDVADGSSDWYDLLALPSDSATEAVSQTKTAVGVYQSFLETAKRDVRKVRLVTSANTNVTYSSQLSADDLTAVAGG